MRFAAFIALMLAGGAAAAPVLRRNIVYAERPQGALLLDACSADGPGPHPVAILVHGGGWAAGSKEGDPAVFFAPLTRAGFTWFSLGYRLTPKAPYPACIEDVETGIGWVERHLSEFGGDPRRLALIGGSAGAHLVALAAIRGRLPAPPAAVVALYCPSDLTDLDRAWTPLVQRRLFSAHPPTDRLAAFAGCDRSDPRFAAVLREASPLALVHSGLPPFLLMHGTADEAVPFAQSQAFQALLREAHNRCDLVAVEGAGHGLVFPGPGEQHKLFEAYPQGVGEVIGWLIAILNGSS